MREAKRGMRGRNMGRGGEAGAGEVKRQNREGDERGK